MCTRWDRRHHSHSVVVVSSHWPARSMCRSAHPPTSGHELRRVVREVAGAHDVVVLELVQLGATAGVPDPRCEVGRSGGAPQRRRVEHACPHRPLWGEDGSQAACQSTGMHACMRYPLHRRRTAQESAPCAPRTFRTSRQFRRAAASACLRTRTAWRASPSVPRPEHTQHNVHLRRAIPLTIFAGTGQEVAFWRVLAAREGGTHRPGQAARVSACGRSRPCPAHNLPCI